MTHDRIHARRPHDPARFRVGRVLALTERDGHAVVTVEPVDDANERSENASERVNDANERSENAGGEQVELTVTLAVRDLFVSRLDLADGASAVGERVWFREHGGS